MEHANLKTTDRWRKVYPFGATHVIEPTSTHTHTIIMLHGRGSTGKEFAEDFSPLTRSDGSSIHDKFPGCRWVFPSSQELWSTLFAEEMPAWFEAHSLTDITARQELQMSGIEDSVKYITTIVQEEVEKLGGHADKLALGGISQGGAIALWTLLCQRNSVMQPGAVVVSNTWLPFAPTIERLFAGKQDDRVAQSNMDNWVATHINPDSKLGDHTSGRLPPVFVGHGTDDTYVDVELGRQATRILSQAGLSVEWKEYSGAEEEGHWFKEPEEMNDIFSFLARWSG